MTIQFESEDEARAWDLYAAGAFDKYGVTSAVLRADELLVERRKRFKKRDLKIPDFNPAFSGESYSPNKKKF